MDEAAVNFYTSAPLMIFYLLTILFIATGVYLWQITGICKNKVLVLTRRKDGRATHRLAAIQNGMVEIGKDEDGKVKMYGISAEVTDTIPYPGGLTPSILQKTIKQLIVEEGNAEPVKRFNSKQTISDELIATMEHERTTAMMNESNMLLEEKDKENAKLRKGTLNPLLIYALLVVTCVGIGYLIMMLYPVIPELQNLEELKKAFGL